MKTINLLEDTQRLYFPAETSRLANTTVNAETTTAALPAPLPTPDPARTEVAITTQLGTIVVELFADTPFSTAQFINNVVNDIYYNPNHTTAGNSNFAIIQRYVPNFVLQGGGFFIDTNQNVNQIVGQPTVASEAGVHANTLYTLAFALSNNNTSTGGLDWFINLTDNSANLGIYAVFGQVVGGAGPLTSILGLPNYNFSGSLGPSFANVPLVNGANANNASVNDLLRASYDVLGVARADSGTTSASAILNGSSVLANDTDLDSPLSIAMVNGAAVSFGSTITLGSGARLIVNADGTYSYNPNHAFDGLAAGTSRTDSFTYTLAGGHLVSGTGTVTITITSATTPTHHGQDFDGGGFGDILWQNTSGGVSVWSGGLPFRAGTYNASVGTDWRAIETFDWNGDGKSDVLWRNTTGSLAIWTGTASGLQQGSYFHAAVGGTWAVAGAGDLNGDGKADIVWRDANGAVSTWLSTGTGFQENAYFHTAVGASWKIAGVGDFNGDGRSDILWRNDNGAVSLWTSTGTGFTEGAYNHAPVATSWHIDGIGDFNGDGKDDILWRNDSGALSVWTSTGSGFQEGVLNASAGTDWQVAQVSDFNGDGLADVLFHNTNGAVSAWTSTGTAWNQNAYFNAGATTDWNVVQHVFPV